MADASERHDAPVRCVGMSRAAMLSHDAGHFDGLSTVEAERLRGRILAGFERDGLPDDALHALREELRTSLSPVVLAGAARAVRSLERVDEEMRALLVEASGRIELRDEYVSFDSAPPLTAREEIARTLSGLGASPGACCGKAPAQALVESLPFELRPEALEAVIVEDQSGRRSALVPLLRGSTSLVAFFYTRCMNPAKCSLTMTRLADLVRRSGAGDRFNVLAFTYDGRFDTPARLRAYGLARGFEFGESARLVRCASGWPAVRDCFRLRVGYGESTVNEHARELFAVGPDLRALGLEPELLADPERLELVLAARSAGKRETIETLLRAPRHRAAKQGGEIGARCSAAPADDSGE
ncbi:MAG: hypothetical protein QOJ27_2346 [Sphingomonadales bacterium]|nr:hypothetical protein [Sphingomonadales bacterium]